MICDTLAAGIVYKGKEWKNDSQWWTPRVCWVMSCVYLHLAIPSSPPEKSQANLMLCNSEV